MGTQDLEEIRMRIGYKEALRRPYNQSLKFGRYKFFFDKEVMMSRNPNVASTTFDKVADDLMRYSDGSGEILINTFLANTNENTRISAVCGRHDKVVYFCSGLKSDSHCLGLLSAHVSGSSGGGGWGFNGDRRIYIAENKRVLPWNDPERWVENSCAFAYEDYNRGLKFEAPDRKDDVYKELLMILVSKEEAKLKERDRSFFGGGGI